MRAFELCHILTVTYPRSTPLPGILSPMADPPLTFWPGSTVAEATWLTLLANPLACCITMVVPADGPLE